MSTIFDRITERLADLIDDVRVAPAVARRLDEAEGLLSAGDPQGCLTILNAVDADGGPVWRSQVLRGLALEVTGDLERAATLLTEAAQQREAVLVRVALSRVATRLGALRSAREHLDVALQRRADDDERLEILRAAALLDERIGPPSRAIPALRQALRIAPQDLDLMSRLSSALADEGDLDGAITTLQPVLTIDPPPLDALLLMGTLRIRRGTSGDRTAAALAYERILERSPDNPDALEGLARTHLDDKQVAVALPLFRQALATANVPQHGAIHDAIGDCYVATGEWDDALDAYRAAAAFGNPDTAVRYAGAALRAGTLDEALAAARDAVEHNPTNKTARAHLGVAELRSGDLGAAQRTLTTLRAAQMAPPVLKALGELALAMGDAVEAMALLREAAVRVPGDADVAHGLEEAVRSLAPQLPTLPNIDELEPAGLAPFLDALGEAVARHPLLTDLIPETTALRQHLDTPLTVAVLGEFNAGKSTLINAFLAENVVATGVLPTTSHVNVIRYGPRKVARWTQMDGAVEEIPYSAAQRLTKREPESIAALEFCFPHPELRSVHFWDTPGFNAPDSAHEQRAREALRTADAVVWMLDANQALTWSEFERLEVIPNRSEKLLVVLNKADRIGDDHEAREAVEDHVTSHMDDDFAGLFWLSALQALRARQDQEAPPTGTGLAIDGNWKAFEQALQSKVFERAGRLKSLEVATGLRTLTREVLSRADVAIAQVNGARDAMQKMRVELTTQRARWTSEVGAQSRSDLNRSLQDARRQILNEIKQLSAPGPGLFAGRELPDDDRRMMQERVVDRATAAYRSVAKEVARAADSVDGEQVALVEEIALTVGPPESRTLRRRLEGYLGETAALRRTLEERLVTAPRTVVQALTRELGDAVIHRVVGQRPDAERDAALQRLIAPVGTALVAQVDQWGMEYLGAALSLCDHVERDLDILLLDLEHRIHRPFSAVLTVIRADDTDAAARALESDTPEPSIDEPV